MNDPNGMVYHDGECHPFYQDNPFGDKWPYELGSCCQQKPRFTGNTFLSP